MTLPVPFSAAELRRLPAVGRAAGYLLHRVPGVVLADIAEHASTPGVARPPGHVSLVVWVQPEPGGPWQQRAPAVWMAVQAGALAFGQHAVVVVREAWWWTRARAWWRRKVWDMRRDEHERRAARRAE